MEDIENLGVGCDNLKPMIRGSASHGSNCVCRPWHTLVDMVLVMNIDESSQRNKTELVKSVALG